MQEASYSLKTQLWDKLTVIFNNYADPKTQEIPTNRMEEIIRNVLGQTSQMQIDYVVKNMFRLDVDQNGSVSLLEFGNFLFKRHCGQMSLQKMHRANLMKNGSQRKMLATQFIQLLNNAYAFLNVSCQKNSANAIFQEADKDKDGLITYVEYFQFIDKYVCQTQNQFAEYSNSPVKKKPEKEESLVKTVDLGRQWNSKLRIYLWNQLRRLYDAYVSSKTLSVNDQELRGLITAILGNVSEMQMLFLLNGLFKLDSSTIEFIPFAIIFIYLVGELGLSRFQKNHPASKRMINREEFVIILNNSFKFLAIAKVRNELLYAIFAKIDKNRDGFITFDEFLDWVKRFLAVIENRGDEFYTLEDDNANGGSIIIVDIIPKQLPKEQIKSDRKSILRFKFISYELAQIVRKRIFQLLVPFDENQNKILEQDEIKRALTAILKENATELEYVTKNVFRYDKNFSGRVTFSEFTNFSVEQHFGEMSIQRLHRVNRYSRGKQRQMNCAQFEMTINNALSYIDLKASPEQIRQIYQVFGTEWITYETYFIFLKEYFGSLSPICTIQYIIDNAKETKKESNKLSPDQLYLESLNSLSPLDRFIRMMIDQLRNIFYRYDFDKNLVFTTDEIQAILQQVLQLSENEKNFVLTTFFRMQSRKGNALTFDELVNILLQVYLVEILMKRKFPNISPSEWKLKKINLEEFIMLFVNGCFFMRLKPLRSDMSIIFNMLDTDKDGYITFADYFSFIRKFLCGGFELPDVAQNKEKSMKQIKTQKTIDSRHGQVPKNVSEGEWNFIQQIWGQLKVYFDDYDTGKKGYLNKDELKQFVIQVLNETTQSQLDYIFLNMSRIDINTDNKTEFEQFAPFILNHAGEIALQKFHREQIKGKNSLTEDELFITFGNAYSFLKTIPKSRNAVNLIYKRIGAGSDVKYGGYLGWIHRALARKFH